MNKMTATPAVFVILLIDWAGEVSNFSRLLRHFWEYLLRIYANVNFTQMPRKDDSSMTISMWWLFYTDLETFYDELKSWNFE